MSFRRPFTSVKDNEEPPILPLPSLSQKSPVKIEDKNISDNSESLGKGIRNLEAVLRSLGVEENISTRITNRLNEIDRELSRINSEIAKLEREKENLLAEREKITKALRLFSGITE
ncbi:MAG: hypothetical protein ACP5IE_03615 [Infirmifilum sp.]|uniref:Uncharacterized protein n=1 Tax=Infirmifilum uzonense TaxID=1550241 RepID=A0A0F7FI98_9CREN|nr:hypothetical protein [Infirmifilum uzonense]AKG38917.1 hypothetical protein MA03_06175 [Infirmifilum uzonense]